MIYRGAQAIGGRGLRSGVEPQAPACSNAVRPALSIARRKSKLIALGEVLEPPRDVPCCTLRLLENKVVELIVERERLHDRAHAQKTASSRIAGNAASFRRRPTAPS